MRAVAVATDDIRTFAFVLVVCAITENREMSVLLPFLFLRWKRSGNVTCKLQSGYTSLSLAQRVEKGGGQKGRGDGGVFKSSSLKATHMRSALYIKHKYTMLSFNVPPLQVQ